MPKLVAPLTDAQIKNAKPKATSYKLSDGSGLYLEVMPTGAKLWRLKFKRANGKESRLALGRYPEVSLAEAREKRLASRKLANEGIDLADHRDAQKAARATQVANNFEAVAREWLAKNKDGWAASHHDKILGRFENDVFPYLGEKPIATITAPELLAVIRRIESRGVLETAHRALEPVMN